jgi:hypothetical protein
MLSFVSPLIGSVGRFTAAAIDKIVNNPGPGTQTMWQQICQTLPFCAVGKNAPMFVATKVGSFIAEVIGGAAVLVILYAAIRLVSARGGEEGVSESKKILLYAVIGLILAIISDAVVYYTCIKVIEAAGGTGTMKCGVLL